MTARLGESKKCSGNVSSQWARKLNMALGEEKVGGKLSRKSGLTSPEEPWAPSDQKMAASLYADEHSGQECGAVCRELQTLSIPWRTDRANWAVLGCTVVEMDSPHLHLPSFPLPLRTKEPIGDIHFFFTYRKLLMYCPSSVYSQSRTPGVCLSSALAPAPTVQTGSYVSLPFIPHSTVGPYLPPPTPSP